MNRIFFAIPGDHEKISGGYIFDRKIFYGLKYRGTSVEWIHLPYTFPQPSQSDLAITEQLLTRLQEGAILILDGLAGCCLPELLSNLYKKLNIIYLVHLPAFLDPRFDEQTRDLLYQSEQGALRYAHRIITSSTFIAKKINGFSNVTVINPGIEAASVKTEYPDHPRKLLMVGNFLPGKGYDDLLEALSINRDLNWKLRCCGDSTMDKNYYREWKKKASRLTLFSRITTELKHDYKELEKIYLNSHLLVFPSHFESFGMAPAEAAAHRLPMLISDGGALKDTIPDKFAVFHKAGDVNDLADKLKRLLTDGNQYGHLVKAYNNSVPRFNTWDDSIRRFYDVLEPLTHEHN